jgi:toxin ParE1/3/4
MAPKWRVRLSAAAELDFANILRWTSENFGARKPKSIETRLFKRSANWPKVPKLRGSKDRGRLTGV